jgi:hypothetical protein
MVEGFASAFGDVGDGKALFARLALRIDGPDHEIP